ncbi:MAG TPA: NifB/NifX family molybdenum-iron cluster-binding protein [Ignavibacteriaceae bacterium]|nr:NifB/NifX family molybdenum-iron cluster-binding protein [Ignavibacteriaceae bacterium]
MKIALSISKHFDSTSLLEVFGRSSHYFIHDTEKKSDEILSNPYYIELGGAGLQSARFLIDQNVDVLITKKIGINPLRFLTSASIKVYQSKDVILTEIIKNFNEGKLNELRISNNNIVIGGKEKDFKSSIAHNN